MSSEQERTVLVNIDDGPVRGLIETVEGDTYYRFLGIPYALPPIGNLRFMPPVRAPSWTDVKDATKQPMHCWVYKYEDTCHGSEDCLYINLSTNCLRPEKPRPVMFYIGNFGYTCLKDPILDGKLLVDEDILLVHCGYRLGVFGFLSINDITAPGNSGLKDVLLALRWVQRNISQFGGDPNNVTLLGSSTGGNMVHLLVLSPAAAGLFHKAIIQSGSALSNSAISKNPTQPLMAIAKELSITTTSKYDIVMQMRALPAETIMQAFEKVALQNFISDKDLLDPVFKPCVEDEFEGQQAFLTKSPMAIIKSGRYHKVPMIFGSNNVEGAIVKFITEDFYENLDRYNQCPSLLVPKTLDLDGATNKKIAKELIGFYMGGESLREDTVNQYLQLISDYHFIYCVNKSVSLHAASSKVFYYIFKYEGDWAVPKSLNLFNTAGHAGELPYIFRIRAGEGAVCAGGRDSLRVRSRVVKMWTNFAKYSDPTPEDYDPLLQIRWEPVEGPDRVNYLCIGQELTKGRNPFLERMQFWDKLHEQYVYLRTVVHFQDIGVRW